MDGSSLVAYLTKFFSDTFAADLQSDRWNTCDLAEATNPPATGTAESALAGSVSARCVSEYPCSFPSYTSECSAWAFQLRVCGRANYFWIAAVIIDHF